MNAACFSGVVYSAIGRKINGFPDERYWKWSADALKEVAKFAADLGITSVSNPINRYESFLIDTCDQGIKLMQMINEPNVKIHLDAYHMNKD